MLSYIGHSSTRIRVLRSNIGKLLMICVPTRNKWIEFGWIGKSVDDILDELTQEDIPLTHPDDPGVLGGCPSEKLEVKTTEAKEKDTEASEEDANQK